MALAKILDSLPKSRPAGQGKYRAPCPVHNGKDFNLMLSEDASGKVGCHCFVCGANGLAVVEALGLSTSELFPPEDGYVRPMVTEKMKSQKIEDSIYQSIYADESKNRRMTLEERRRNRKAEARLEGIRQMQERSA